MYNKWELDYKRLVEQEKHKIIFFETKKKSSLKSQT